MIVIKDNVELVIAEDQLDRYRKEGFTVLGGNPVQLEEKHLNDLTVPELKKLAEEKGIEGASSLNKAELLKVLGE